jgi:Ca2+-binding EF-hand superfamily protein
MDEDGSGDIDFNEFKSAMHQMAGDGGKKGTGLQAVPPEEELKKAFDDVDEDGGGSIDFEEVGGRVYVCVCEGERERERKI